MLSTGWPGTPQFGFESGMGVTRVTWVGVPAFVCWLGRQSLHAGLKKAAGYPPVSEMLFTCSNVDHTQAGALGVFCVMWRPVSPTVTPPLQSTGCLVFGSCLQTHALLVKYRPSSPALISRHDAFTRMAPSGMLTRFVVSW